MGSTGNPILDNPNLKAAMVAQMAQQNAPPPAAVTMPAGGAPASPSILSGMPQLPSAPQPSVAAPRGTTAGDTNELSRKLSTGSGISQIHGKIENSGFGQAHPMLGKILGIGAQGLAQIGDIGLRSLAPGIDAAVPGTELHHDVQVRQDQRQVAGDTENDKSEAQTDEARALAGEAQARESAIENPQPKPEKGETWKTLLGGNGQLVTAPNGKIVQESSLGNLRYGNLPEGATVTPKPTSTGASAFEQWSSDPEKYEGFQRAMAELKAQVAAEHPHQAANSSFMNVYAAQRFLQMAYKDNPALLPVASKMIGKLLNLSPEETASMGAVPENQPLSPETGHPIGTSMPEAPTGSTRSQAQTAVRVLTELPRIRQDVATLGSELGPTMGRWNDFITGKVGAGDPRFEKLRTDIQFVNSAAAKFHLNSVRAVEEFNKLASAGKMTPEVLGGYLDAVHDWADTAQRQERGAGEDGHNHSPERPANVPQSYIFKDGPKGKGWYKPGA